MLTSIVDEYDIACQQLCNVTAPICKGARVLLDEQHIRTICHLQTDQGPTEALLLDIHNDGALIAIEENGQCGRFPYEYTFVSELDARRCEDAYEEYRERLLSRIPKRRGQKHYAAQGGR